MYVGLNNATVRGFVVSGIFFHLLVDYEVSQFMYVDLNNAPARGLSRKTENFAVNRGKLRISQVSSRKMLGPVSHTGYFTAPPLEIILTPLTKSKGGIDPRLSFEKKIKLLQGQQEIQRFI